MSEQKTSFMVELDQWTQSVVIDPLLLDVADATERAGNHDSQQHLEQTIAEVKKAIRQKVLESYRNGQGATPGAKPSRPSSFRPRRRDFSN